MENHLIRLIITHTPLSLLCVESRLVVVGTTRAPIIKFVNFVVKNLNLLKYVFWASPFLLGR